MPAISRFGATSPIVSNAGPTSTADIEAISATANSQAKAAGAKAAAKVKKPAKKKPAKKKTTATSRYLAGDTTYQQQLADFNRSKADYESNYNRQSGIINRDYAESQRTLNRQGAQDRIDQQNDFAGRGILRSGVFAKALGDYNTEFNTRLKALTTGRTDQIGDLSSQRTSFLRQLAMEMNNAKQDAIRRRAAKLGI